MKLHFTEQEMAEFLMNRGYSIWHKVSEREDHVHGSAFTTVRYELTVAYGADSKPWPLEDAFWYELKKKLLL